VGTGTGVPCSVALANRSWQRVITTVFNTVIVSRSVILYAVYCISLKVLYFLYIIYYIFIILIFGDQVIEQHPVLYSPFQSRSPSSVILRKLNSKDRQELTAWRQRPDGQGQPPVRTIRPHESEILSCFKGKKDSAPF
jgi:hypothetical protein